MTNKSFMLLIAVVAMLGVSIGGAFVGGIALGKSQDAEASQVATLAPSPSGGFQQANGTSDGSASLAQIRQRIQSGEVTPEELAELRQQFQSGGFSGGGFSGAGFQGSGFGGDGFRGGDFGSGLSGTIEAVDGNVITVDTPQGPLQATITDETTIQTFSVGTLEDLLQGLRVTVVGHQAEGAVEASSIMLVPEGSEGFFGGGFSGRGSGDGFFGGDRFGHEQTAP